MQPSSTTARHDQEDIGGSVSRLHTHDDDDVATLQSAISGERSVLMPSEGTWINPYNLAYQGHSGDVEQKEDSKGAAPAVRNPSTGARPCQEDTEAERGTRPSPPQAGARLELASSRYSREVSSSNPLPMQEAVATQDGVGTPMPPFGDQPTTHTWELDPVGEEGPEDLAGRDVAVVRDLAREGERYAQPGAYRVDGINATDDATEDGIVWGRVEQAVRADHEEEDLFSAQLVDPEADRREIRHDVRREVRRGTNQVTCLLLVVVVVVVVVVVLFAIDVIPPPTSPPATSPSASNPPNVSGSRPSVHPSTSPIAAMTPSLQSPTQPSPTPSATSNPPAPSPVPMLNPTPFPSPLPVTPAPVLAPGHVAQWVQVGDDIDGENPGDWSGSAVALSSNGAVLAIGAERNDGGGGDAGHVRVYINAGGGWEQRGSDLDGLAAGDEFGWSVSLSANGTILAVGAIFADGGNGIDSGRVHVFQWMSNAWKPLGSTLDGAGAGDQFGHSLALSDDGTILAVGARLHNVGGSIAGHVQVFEWTGTDWTQRGNDLLGSSPGDLFGNAVWLSSDGFVLACGGNQFNNAGPGYVQIHRWSGSAWKQEGPTLMGFASNDDFGRSVSLSGDGSVVAVGASLGNYAVVYRNDGTDWVQIGQTIHGEASGDDFGWSLSLSSDGKTVLIGGYGNNSNGSLSGHALVFRLSPNGQEWMQVGQELVGEAALDWFGYSTSISDSGTRISIGAFYNDGNGDSAGHVRVYDLQ